MIKLLKHNLLKNNSCYVMCSVVVLLLLSVALPALARVETAQTTSVFIEELTSPEVEALIKSGYTTAIIPTGGSEQNLSHMAIGKHNRIIGYTAEKIAKNLGKALVAPVMAYVPEGEISPPAGHMRYAGTLSLQPETFYAVLGDVVASLKQHGFTLICLMGEHGDSQKPQQELADVLSKKWAGEGVRVINISDYYSNNGQDAWVSTLNLPLKDMAAHAGFEDTSELMAIDGKLVREPLRKDDALLASKKYGSKLLELKILAATTQIKNAQNKTK